MEKIFLTYNFKLILFVLFFSFLLFKFSVFFKINYKKKRHERKISTAEKVISKVNSFTGDYKNQQILSYLRKIDPYVFEELILSSLALKGFEIIRNASYSGDGGLDGMFLSNEKIFLVQAKRYSNTVNSTHINDFALLVSHKKAAGGMFIHTGKTAVKSYQNYKNSNIEIVSGQKLINLILHKN